MISQLLTDDTGDYAPGISAVITDAAGKNLMSPVVSDNEGHFNLPDDLLSDTTGKKLKIYGNGIETKIINAGDIGAYAIKVTPTTASHDGLGQNILDRPVTVKANYTLPLILGSLSILCIVIGIVVKK